MLQYLIFIKPRNFIFFSEKKVVFRLSFQDPSRAVNFDNGCCMYALDDRAEGLTSIITFNCLS